MKILGGLMFAVSLAACGGSADDGRTSVVASLYPLAYVAEQVGGNLVDVDSLTRPGVEPHDLELEPRQVAAVQDADLVVYQRHFQAAVDDGVDQADRSADTTVDADAELRAGGDDPHIWLDPTNLVTLANTVAARLVAVDPEHADQYRANAAAFVGRLTALDDAFTTGLRTCERRTIVTSHAAFGHLAARYDLTQVPIAGIDPTNEPSPSQLGDVTRLVRAEGITTIFTEELVSPDIADTIAAETGAVTATLDPVEGLSDETSDEDYLTLMDRNLATLRTANGCS